MTTGKSWVPSGGPLTSPQGLPCSSARSAAVHVGTYRASAGQPLVPTVPRRRPQRCPSHRGVTAGAFTVAGGHTASPRPPSPAAVRFRPLPPRSPCAQHRAPRTTDSHKPIRFTHQDGTTLG
ncbi:hypothetical protein NDU88_000888 [Pleurodeles waltl]|uniref:Uncharacterized protein n=1 Tax=Pleurodeles waltl TaxID=8319 RepID=A0AAV7THK4_PLEWA|nr:hypothetical protein NDU88_000888 [Pleurodeles waltl]